MLVLGIESSCDETAAAVVRDGRIILSNVVASQIATHAPFGGVVPELASREHLSCITRVARTALELAGIEASAIDGIAVTRGPGLVGSLLVGIGFAKSLAFTLDRPIVGVNHIEGHVYSVAFEHPAVEYPAVALIVSGGHTSLFLIPRERRYAALGRTRDDAAGEAYDKVAKLLGLGYPGGPVLDRLAQTGEAGRAELVFSLPRMNSHSLDFSFSGLKTAVLRYVREAGLEPVDGGGEPGQAVRDLAASFQDKVVRSLMSRLREGVKRHRPRTIILAGGVACNTGLRRAVEEADFGAPVYYPSPALTTDNAAMIAAAGHGRLAGGESDGFEFSARASLRLENFEIEGYESRKHARYKT